MTESLSVYSIILKEIGQFLPQERITRVRNLALLMTGILLARHVHLPKLAEKLSLWGTAKSVIQRLRRFLQNERLDVRAVYDPFGRALLQALAGTRIRLLIDRTDWKGHNLLYVAVAYRKRAVPLIWKELGHRGCCKLAEQKELLDIVADWLPPGSEVCVIGDREFRGTGLMRYIRSQGWHHTLRLKGDTWVLLPTGEWVQLRDIPIQRGERKCFQGVYLTRKRYGPVNLAVAWAEDEEKDEPWYIATDTEANAQTRVPGIYLIRNRPNMVQSIRSSFWTARKETTLWIDVRSVWNWSNCCATTNAISNNGPIAMPGTAYPSPGTFSIGGTAHCRN